MPVRCASSATSVSRWISASCEKNPCLTSSCERLSCCSACLRRASAASSAACACATASRKSTGSISASTSPFFTALPASAVQRSTTPLTSADSFDSLRAITLAASSRCGWMTTSPSGCGLDDHGSCFCGGWRILGVRLRRDGEKGQEGGDHQGGNQHRRRPRCSRGPPAPNEPGNLLLQVKESHVLPSYLASMNVR
jgi:hypothetical protein